MSIACFAACSPPPKRRCTAYITIFFAFVAAVSIFFASFAFIAGGFSQITCLPPCSAAIVTGACRMIRQTDADGVDILIGDQLLRVGVLASRAGDLGERSFRRDGIRSATATILNPPASSYPFACSPPGQPPPMIPTLMPAIPEVPFDYSGLPNIPRPSNWTSRRPLRMTWQRSRPLGAAAIAWFIAGIWDAVSHV